MSRPATVDLFVTCLIDTLYPQVAQAVVDLLAAQGVEVRVPSGQTCCGQPAFNAGFWNEARAMAQHTLDVFGDSETPIVIPSGSCASMLIHHYPLLFEDDPVSSERANCLAVRVVEFSQFMVDGLGITDVGAHYPGSVVYHPSCHLTRPLGIRNQPRKLLAAVSGLELREQIDADVCCGFGGVFSIKMEPISGAMLQAKLNALEATGAELVLGCDISCLTHIEGGLRKRGSKMRTMHLAEFLAAYRGGAHRRP